jgi:hypothetical protein
MRGSEMMKILSSLWPMMSNTLLTVEAVTRNSQMAMKPKCAVTCHQQSTPEKQHPLTQMMRKLKYLR